MKSKKTVLPHLILKILIISLVVFSALALSAITIAHTIVFSRSEYSQYDSTHYLLHSDIDEKQYPCEILSIPSGDHMLAGYLYGADQEKGLIIISPGHRDASDIKLYEVTYFVDAGWSVLCYDYTGCYNSQGKSMVGYTQSVHDLDAVLTYVEAEQRFKALPTVLFGHSLGAYASATVLQYGHTIQAAIIASGFDTPKEQWSFSIKRYTSILHPLVKPYNQLFIALKYGKEATLSAIDGINAVNIPVLVISGTNDIFYGAESPIYQKKTQITNPHCQFLYETKTNHNGHYDYFLTDAALDYQKQLKNYDSNDKIDKALYMQHDIAYMKQLNDFYEKAIHEKNKLN